MESFINSIEAYTAGFISARSRLNEALKIFAEPEFEDQLILIGQNMKDIHDVKFLIGHKRDKLYVRLEDCPSEWFGEVPDPEIMEQDSLLAYVRGAFEANGCFSHSTKNVKGKLYDYPRLQFYYRPGEEWIADFVYQRWTQWLGDLGMTAGKPIAISKIKKGQSNRTQDTFVFAVSGKRCEVMTSYMYHHADVSLLRKDLVRDKIKS